MSSWSEEDIRLMSFDNKAKNVIVQACPPSILHNMYTYTTAKQMWDHFVRTYEGDDDIKRTNKDTLTKSYEDFVGYDSESVTEIYT